MATPDDELTADVLAMVASFSSGNRDILAHTIAQASAEDLRAMVPKLIGLVDLRARIGHDMNTTAEWARWLLNQQITL